MLRRLETLHQQGFLTDLDLHFTRLMARLANTESPELLLGAYLVSNATGNGNVCVNINSLAGRPLLDEAGESLLAPDPRSWFKVLRESPVVGRPGEFQPLILDDQGRLYLYRYWDYERRLAEDLLARAIAQPEAVDEARLRNDLNRLFPPSEGDGVTNWQKVAAAVAALKGLCIISGGPGTGKTTTVIRILALLVGQSGNRALNIGLAAPTGKAAARLQEAIRLAKQRLELDPALSEAIPEEASTLHRLLGVKPGSVYFRHNRENPLPLDVLVVDEASMVDLALMAKLTQALPRRARLILLGDKDQLASVEAGAVLGDICGVAPGFSEAFRTQLQQLTGETIAAGETNRSPLRDSIVLLKRSYRFGAASGIGKLALAVNRGQGEEAVALLESGGFSELSWQPLAADVDLRARLTESIDKGYRPYLEAVQANAGPEAVFAAFERFRVLCAHRSGPAGVEELNRLIETILQSRRLLNARQTWYPGRPVLVSRNDYNLRLFNGDVGITLPDADGRLRVVFQTGDGGLRRLPPSRLPEHETVYAMTVHKSQGSEFDRVLLALPFETSRIMTRELVYTGITRAREAVEIWGNADGLRAAAARGLWRSSGLRDGLWGRFNRGLAE